jgi:hypothetical protein
MREIDPLREPSEALLSAALHRLAKSSPGGAPEQLGANLARSFRKHHARRRRAKVAGWAALAACLIVAAVLAFRLAARNEAPVSPRVAVQAQLEQSPSVVGKAPQPLAGHSESARTIARSNTPTSIQDSGFVPLPTYDPEVGTGDLQVVRLELSGADLRLVGAPVAEDFSDRRILADVAVGRDGTPYAVRFVQ